MRPTRDAFMAASLGQLQGYWLDVRCGCGKTSKLPCKLLARQRGARVTVTEVLARLRCSCGLRPERVDAVDDPSAGAFGGAPAGWRLGLTRD